MTQAGDNLDRRTATDVVTWKAYVDAIFGEHRVQVQAALSAHDNRLTADQLAVAERLERMRREFMTMLESGTGVDLRDYVEALFVEGRRATEIAERERAAAARALRTEQRQKMDVAEREREKSAQALALNLRQSILDGDERLREHIGNQVEQINAALASVESRAQIRHEAHRTQMDDRFGYTEVAVAKAEQATERRFHSVNAFREQLADQAQHFLPREVADTQFEELRKVIAAITRRLDLEQGNTQGTTASMAQVMAVVGLLVAIGAILVGAFT